MIATVREPDLAAKGEPVVLIEAWKQVVVRRYAQFTGRSGRPEFWWFFLANFIIALVLGLLGLVSVAFAVIYGIYALALLIPSLAVSIRRLHDINRTGWWVLLALIPLVGGIVLLVFHATAGDPTVNRFGPPPPPLPA
jgi:uncharacterized membrane protein YhaH (DUF805 family)